MIFCGVGKVHTTKNHYLHTITQYFHRHQLRSRVVKVQEAQAGKRDGFEQRYTLDFTIEWQNRSAIPRSDWIIETRFAETIA
ncbi:MAG: hypothetical protein KME15_05110 [Drouetiella hepatica Uher 2000/2452]|jgi:hypothetical protein|uniref:Uncharacterized protein n=1 Tax=Drouetiella hepatica Uher 2000/2452 TaxID=904376 RepID=A0A951Q8W4_9CYAN|nr:hypothetical protein [Drouetiella hepatica Uher 2000/2452]